MGDDTPFHKVSYVCRAFVITTKLSSIVWMEKKKKKKKKKTDRTRWRNSWHHKHTRAKQRRHASHASKKSTLACNWRHREKERKRERETEERQKSMNGIRGLSRWKQFDYDEFFNSSSLLCGCLSLSFFLSLRLHHKIRSKGGNWQNARERENVYSIFGILKQVSVLILSSMFVYSLWCAELDDLWYSWFFRLCLRRKTQFKVREPKSLKHMLF